MSQRQLAELLQLDKTAISHWENGRSAPRHIERLVAALGLSMAKFYGPLPKLRGVKA